MKKSAVKLDGDRATDHIFIIFHFKRIYLCSLTKLTDYESYICT
jgi:hypothetical protein